MIATSGGYYSLALKEDGTVVHWGDSSNRVDGIPEGLWQVTTIAAGPRFMAALRADSTVVAWGETAMRSLYAVPAGLKGVIALSVGETHVVALKADGSLATWGYVKSAPSGLKPIKAIAAGPYYTLALQEDSTVIAWGLDEEGRLDLPRDLRHVTAIAAGGLFGIAIREPSVVGIRPRASPFREASFLSGPWLTVPRGARAAAYDARGRLLRRFAPGRHDLRSAPMARGLCHFVVTGSANRSFTYVAGL